MNKRLTPIHDDEQEFPYESYKSLTPLPQASSGMYSPFNEASFDYRINEAIKANNSQRLISMSQQKKQTSESFFAKVKPRNRTPTSSIYRICYGENVIPSAAEVGHRSTYSGVKPFIPPEYREYEYQPQHLPLFLKERLYKTVKTKKPIYPVATSEEGTGFVEQGNSGMGSDPLPSLPGRSRLLNNHTVSMKEFGKTGQGSMDSGNAQDYPYLSPKARQQVQGDSVPLLLTNVILSGAINPQGLASQDEAAIEHVITDFHKKIRYNSVSPARGRNYTPTLEKMNSIVLSMSLAQQNKKKKERELVLQKKNPKYSMDKVGTKLRATVGYIKAEKEEKKKRVLELLKTRNFNLFKPSTINNLHILNEAFKKESIEYL